MVTQVSLAPQRLDITARAGAPLDVTIPLVTEAGDAADLTGLVPVAQATRGTDRLIFAASLSGSSAVQLELTAAETAAQVGCWEWDLVLTSAGLVIASPVAGLLTLGALVTDVSVT